MTNYKIIIQYDGTRYRGWQALGSTELTIQGKIQAVISELAESPVEITGSGRTDAGVHAKGQVANFHMKGGFTEQEILHYLNRYLPEDIAVLSVEQADERFHSRYQAKEKTYLYRIHTGEIPNVFERKYMYCYDKTLLTGRMREAAEYLTGTHDFKAFCGNRKMKKSSVRTIYKIRIAETEDEIQIFFTGNGFLQNMVRIITGTLIEVGDGRRKPQEIKEILESGRREEAGYTVPACGLTLLGVKYE